MITPHTKESLVAFEAKIASHFANGELPCLIHLSGGNEDELLRIFATIRENDWVFSSHRNHLHALLKGIPEAQLEADILAGNSMFVFSAAHRFFTSAILAGTCCIAAGVALDIKRSGRAEHVYCFIGDGAEDNGHAAEAIRYATGHDLPITFVIEDNDRQVDTDYATRWGTTERFNWNSPKVHRYHYTPTFPHGGAGLKTTITFKPDRVEALRAHAAEKKSRV